MQHVYHSLMSNTACLCTFDKIGSIGLVGAKQSDFREACKPCYHLSPLSNLCADTLESSSFSFGKVVFLGRS